MATNECGTGGALDFDGPPREVFGRTVRTEHFRYTEWDDGHFGAELYDEADDPYEFVNRVDDPQYQKIRKELQAALHAVPLPSADP